MNKFNRFCKEYKGFFLLLFCMFVFRSAVADWSDVPTGSMKPTIIEGDRVFINKMAYDIRVPFTHLSIKKLADPKVGEIIVFDSKVSDKRLIKRVVGVPGDVVEMRDNKLYKNGKALAYVLVSTNHSKKILIENLDEVEHAIQIDGIIYSDYSNFSPLIVPENQYLVLGDNRNNSADSRAIGFVPRHEIVGKSGGVAFSLDYENNYLPRTDRFFKSF